MKTLIISHIADVDGLSPVILGKLAYGNVDYFLTEPFTLTEDLHDLIHHNKCKSYDKIFITDLSINQAVIDEIESNDDFKNKVLIFDHHQNSLEFSNLDYVTAVDLNPEGVRESGTSLFYGYLLNTESNSNIKKESVKTYVELVQALDTWTWVDKKNTDAKKLMDLHTIYGNNYYLNYFYEYLINNDIFRITEEQYKLLDIEQTRIDEYIEKKKMDIYTMKVEPYKIGVVFAESYRSELGNALATFYQDEYDFIIMINMSRSISFRGIKDIDLSAFAATVGGKGHKRASGAPLPNNIQQEIIKMIFKNAVVSNENVKSKERFIENF